MSLGSALIVVGLAFGSSSVAFSLGSVKSFFLVELVFVTVVPRSSCCGSLTYTFNVFKVMDSVPK